MNQEITRQIRVYGIVQGVGFRPTVSRHATARGIRGNVCNKGPYVEIYAQGPEEEVNGFISDIQNHPPQTGGNPEDKCGKRRKAGALIHSLTLSRVKKQKERFLFHRILQSVKNVKKKCLTRKTGDICIRLSIVPVVDRVLPFWMHFLMTGNGPV